MSGSSRKSKRSSTDAASSPPGSPAQLSTPTSDSSSPPSSETPGPEASSPKSRRSLPTSARVHEGIAPTLQASASPNRGGSEGPIILETEVTPGMGETATALHSSVTSTVARDMEALLAVEETTYRATGLSTQQTPKDAEEVAPTLQVPSKSGGGQPTAVALTSLSEDSPAKTSASPGSEKDSAAGAPASTGSSSDSFEALALFGPAQSSSKMSPASFPLAHVVDAESAESFYDGISGEAVQALRLLTAETPEATPQQTSPSSGARLVKPHERSASDILARILRWSAPRWRTSGTASATEYSTADTSESPKDGAASSSSLSSILQSVVDPRYYLSPRAALGILLRAGRRGRELPPHLLAALEEVVKKDETMWASYTATESEAETT